MSLDDTERLFDGQQAGAPAQVRHQASRLHQRKDRRPIPQCGYLTFRMLDGDIAKWPNTLV